MSNPFEEILLELTEIKGQISTLKSSSTPPTEVIDRPELLKRLGISEPTAITWGKKGIIPEMRIGSNVRYNWPSVVLALESQSIYR
jgi:predicted DNA-binding transcriptional regulator AlpA